jgi:hypothetical protein
MASERGGMMDKLIRRGTLIENIEKSGILDLEADAWVYNFAIAMIENTPTVDAAPVVHAEWIRQKSSVGSWTHPTYKCSICGNGSNTDDKFCSECGSSMEQWVNGKSKWE